MIPRPINDWVCIDRDKTPDMVGSIHLSITVGRKKATQGTVIAVGKGKKRKLDGERIPMSVKPGDRVMFRQYDVEKLKEIKDENGKPYIFVRDDELVAVIG